jgi:hypothetical protein
MIKDISIEVVVCIHHEDYAIVIDKCENKFYTTVTHVGHDEACVPKKIKPAMPDLPTLPSIPRPITPPSPHQQPATTILQTITEHNQENNAQPASTTAPVENKSPPATPSSTETVATIISPEPPVTPKPTILCPCGRKHSDNRQSKYQHYKTKHHLAYIKSLTE